MHARRFANLWLRVRPAVAAGLILSIVGCETLPLPGGGDLTQFQAQPSQAGGARSDVSAFQESGDNNDAFESAQPAPVPVLGEITLNGTITSSADVDFYNLGPAQAGERIVVDVTGLGGLNAVASLFDAQGDLIDANDDRSYYGGVRDPYIAQPVRADTAALYLGIAASGGGDFGLSQAGGMTGSYSARVRREGVAPLPPARQQVVYLDFEGGAQVQIGLEPIETMRPFRAESISSRLAGETDAIIAMVLTHVRRDFASYDVVLLNSRQNGRPSGFYSQLFFGNYNARFLGLADNVDTGNASLHQEAIIYAEDLSLFESLQPSVEEVAQALANIASHELGHLLGLEHTADAADLMSTASSARQILEYDASFLRAVLNRGVFPIGWQNNPVTLMQNVGPSATPAGRVRVDDPPALPDPSFRDLLELPDVVIPKCNRCEAGA